MKSNPSSVEVELAGHRLRATSVAGVETCIEVPALDLCFDIGRCPMRAVQRRTVLISHGHVDHLGGLIHHVHLRSMWRLSPSRVVLPEAIRDDVDQLLTLWRRISGMELPCELVPVAPGDRVELGRGACVEALRATHRVPTLAWLVEHTRMRLKPEFQGLSGLEIGARRKAGEEVSEPVTRVEMGFTADTQVDLLDREPRLLQARLLVCECTFVPEEGRDVQGRARRSGHVQLGDLAERADRFQNEAVLLTHFSTRYGTGAIRDALGALPEELRGRVHALPLLET